MDKGTFDFSSFIAERVPPATANTTTGWDPRGRPKYDFVLAFQIRIPSLQKVFMKRWDRP